MIFTEHVILAALIRRCVRQNMDVSAKGSRAWFGRTRLPVSSELCRAGVAQLAGLGDVDAEGHSDVTDARR